MDSPSDGRCKRSAGPKWRCGEAASPGKSYCERHLLQRKNQSQKRRIPRNEGDEESEHRSNNTTRRRMRRRRTIADDLSSRSELEASDSKLIGNFARNQRLKKKMIDQDNDGACGIDEDSDKGLMSVYPVKKVSRVEHTKQVGLSSKTQEGGSLMCHQCQRNDKSGVVFCTSCNRKRYCYECLDKWYPGKTREEVENACPFCWGNCNCKACLREVPVLRDREVNASVKLHRLLYLLYKALPVLRHIHREQSSELEIEAKIRGSTIRNKCIEI